MEYYYIILIGIYNIVSIGVYLLYMDNNLVSSIIITGGAIASSIIGVIIASSKNIKTIEKLDVKVDKDHSGLSKEHDRLENGQKDLLAEHNKLMVKQEKLLDKQGDNREILLLIKQQIEDERKNQDSIRANIGSELSKSVDSSIATLQILAEEIRRKNETIQELMLKINDLIKENERLEYMLSAKENEYQQNVQEKIEQAGDEWEL